MNFTEYCLINEYKVMAILHKVAVQQETSFYIMRATRITPTHANIKISVNAEVGIEEGVSKCTHHAADIA